MTVSALLLDADGVVQRNPAGWLERVTACVPAPDRDRFARELWEAEEPALTGSRTFDEVLADVCARWGIEAHAELLRELWREAEVADDVVEVVREVRGAGTPVHLVTNQNDVRAAYLRDVLGYDELFDRLFVSCELGRTKQDEVFFTTIVAELGVPAHRLLLVDDSEAHVATARKAGLQASCWSLDDGVADLRRRLATLLR